MRLSIRHKLFLTLLAAAALVVLAMYGFMHWSFQHGFVAFLEGRQQARIERLVERLAELHEESGDWRAVRDDPRFWRSLLIEDAMEHAPPGMARGHGVGHGRPLDGGYVLFDADRQRLAGRPIDAAVLRLNVIRSNGVVVGYLGTLPGRSLREVVDIRFLESQRRAFLVIALIVALVAIALSWPLANALVRPVRRLADGARALAAGRFETRVAAPGSDELGDLGRDFNLLAQTLERTDSARRQWMADISHELRTPLAVLRAELEALQDGVRPLDGASVGNLQTDVERLGRLVEDLYQLSMTDLGAMSYHPRPVDPTALLADDVEALRDAFERQGLDLSFTTAIGRPVTLMADPDRLSQLFRNLLSNSLRYTDAGGRLVVRTDMEGGRWRAEFCDSAPGVPEASLPRLFERFYRVEASRSRAHGGAGLGLAICRNIVAAHAGRIEAVPSPLGGLCVRVDLPVAP